MHNCTPMIEQWQPTFKGCSADIAGLLCKPRGPEKGEVLSPWVEIEFNHGGKKITVGNHSSPNSNTKHTAVIQSFEFGHTDGMEVLVVVQDQEGGSFVDFVDNVFKDWNCLAKNPGIVDPIIQFKFGWVKSGCMRPLPTAQSHCYYALIDGIDTSFSGGKFIAELTCVDIGKRMFEGHSDEVKGDDGKNKMCLADAIRELLTNSEPPNVEFVSFRRMVNNVPQPCGFQYYDEECNMGNKPPKGADGKIMSSNKGKKDKWDPKSQPKLEAVMRWLSGWSTDGNPPKGWVPQYNPTVPGGEIIFWEDAKPDCEQKIDEFFSKNCYASYIINGSKDSPVLEFNPKIHWDFSRLQGGGGAAGDGKIDPYTEEKTEGKSPGRRNCSTLTRAALPGAGHPTQTITSEPALASFGSDAQNKTQESNEKQIKAFRVTHDQLTTELVIVGDPTYNPMHTIYKKYLHIAFINPYFLQEGTGCQDWTVSKPPCNEVLSSKAWLINKVVHKIELGKYTTHLTIVLAVGAIDGEIDNRIGLWVNGWKPKTCS